MRCEIHEWNRSRHAQPLPQTVEGMLGYVMPFAVSKDRYFANSLVPRSASAILPLLSMYYNAFTMPSSWQPREWRLRDLIGQLSAAGDLSRRALEALALEE